MAKAADNTVFHWAFGRLGMLRRNARADFSKRKFSQEQPAEQDSCSPPVIRRVEQEAGKILVQTGENMIVTRVRLTLLDAAAEVVQIGEATRRKGDRWEFSPTGRGRILIVEAWSPAGHVTRLVF